jgi:hypothetical protein
MSTTIKTGWLNDKNGDKFAPKTLISQIQTSDGTLLEKVLEDTYATKAYIEELLYKPIAINSFTVSPSEAEIGSTVSSLTFKWTTSKTPNSITIDNTSITPTSKTEHTLSSTVTGYTEYELKVTDEKDKEVSKKVSINFKNRIYWGTITKGTSPTGDTIKDLSNNTLSNDKARSVNITLEENQNFVYAYPRSFGKATFRVGAFEMDLGDPQEVDYTNGNTTTKYYVYSAYLGAGSTSITIS